MMTQATKKPIWKNMARYSDRPYTGVYVKLNGKRSFVLRGTMEDGQEHSMEYESHFQAKRNGWEKDGKK